MIGCNMEALPLSEYGSFIRVEPYPRPRPAADEAECGALCDELLEVLFAERNMVAAFNLPYPEKRKIVREYMNRRFPAPVPERFLAAQDKLFWTETLCRGVEEIDGLRYKEGIAVYAGDITRLNADAIVNSASGELTGCYIPLHNCIDNIIHSRAGLQLREDCAAIVRAQGRAESAGCAKITSAYNLPCRYVLHTVGPRVALRVGETERSLLKSCYLSCLDLAREKGLKSVAFCCISTGVFNFPAGEAAEIAVGTAKQWLMKHADYPMRVIFDVFTGRDEDIYTEILRLM